MEASYKVCEVYAEPGEDWPHHLAICDANGDEIAIIVHRPGPPIPTYKWVDAHCIVVALTAAHQRRKAEQYGRTK